MKSLCCVCTEVVIVVTAVAVIADVAVGGVVVASIV